MSTIRSPRSVAHIAAIISAGAVMAWASVVWAQPAPPPPPSNQPILEDITHTKHNLSSVDPSVLLSSGVLPRPGSSRDAKSEPGGTSEICVFCHTPHGSSATSSALRAPIWNRNLDYQATQPYQLYDQVWSFSFEGTLNDAAGRRPTGYSRLCLSCHDGTVALGNVINAPGSGGYLGSIPMTGNLGPGGTIPQGSGNLTGDTRRLALDLRNDHPISFAFDQALVAQDQELVDPGPPLQAPSKVSDPTPISPLRRYPGNDPTTYDSVQCTSCHNPHQVNYPKFLRANWFQKETNNPDPTKNNQGQQILCLFCHDKPRWIDSTHAISTAVRSQYPLVNNDPTNVNSGYDYDGSHTVSEFACRNCHDPHTVQGAIRLHREGVNGQGNESIESTCFLCHAPNNAPTTPGTLVAGDPTSPGNPRFISGTGRPAPDIYGEFAKDIGVGNCPTFPKCGSAMNLQLNPQAHQPVFVSRPQEGVELDSPTPPAGNEFPPGNTSPDSAHIECVDCHNPHQVVRDNRLRGMKGITVGDQVIETTPSNLNRPYVYEICFRCHGNSYTNIFNGDRYPEDVPYRSNPLWPPSNVKFSMAGFSNKRLEFATYGDAGQEILGTKAGVISPPNASYLRGTPWPGDPSRVIGPGINKAFHPVVAGGRNGSTQLTKQLSQWSGGRLADTITIQCTDCHNSDYYDAYGGGGSTIVQSRFLGPITESNAVRPGDVQNLGIAQDYNGERSQHPIGPHGSANIRILRAPYNTDIADPRRSFKTDGFTTNGTLFPAFPGQQSHWDNFLLCFQCHDRRAFDPNAAGANPNDNTWTNFFGVPVSPNDDIGNPTSGNPPTGRLSWESNLHQYHLMRTGALCHECHYNIHSNVETQNTIYGDGTGCVVDGSPPCPSGSAGLPPDAEDGKTDGVSDTHLINFAPGGPTLYSGERRCDAGPESADSPPSVPDTACTTPSPADPNQDQANTNARLNVFNGVEGVTAPLPVWYYVRNPADSAGVFRCNLRCHGVVMSTCFYITDRNFDKVMSPLGPNPATANETWCAGGQAQQAPLKFGAAPPAIRKLLTDLSKGLLPASFSGARVSQNTVGSQATAHSAAH